MQLPAFDQQPHLAADLVELLRNRFATDDLRFAFSLGTPGPQRKPVLMILDPDGRSLGFAKLGWNTLTRALVRNEAAALDRLGRARLDAVVLPRILLLADLGKWSILLTAPIDMGEGAATTQLQQNHLRMLLQLAEIDRESATFDNSAFLAKLHGRMRQLDRHSTFDIRPLHATLAFVQARLDGTILPWTWRLGDFTPANTGARGAGPISVIDLEYSEPNSLPGWDVFHFLENAPGGASAATRRSSQEVQHYFSALGIRPEHIAILRLAYWLDVHTFRLMMWRAIPLTNAASAAFALERTVIARLAASIGAGMAYSDAQGLE